MPRLTLTYGLRWEWQTPPWETHNKSGEVSLHDARFLAPEIYRAPLCLLEERTEARSAART